MVAGADSIDDTALLRHGGMGLMFTGALIIFAKASDACQSCIDLRFARSTPLAANRAELQPTPECHLLP